AEDDALLLGRVARGGDELLDVLVAPGAEVSAHWLDLPGNSPAQARAAASFLLAEELAVTEGLHFAVAEPDETGRRLVLVCNAERLSAWLDEAAALGAEPAYAVPDYLLLEEPVGDEVIAASLGARVAVRGREVAFSAERELAESLVSGREVRWIDDADFEAMMAARAATPEVNLLQGPYGKGAAAPARGGWRRPAMLAAAVLLSPLLVLGAHIARDEWTAHSLRSQAAEQARTVAPSAEDPVASLRRQVARREAADQFPGVAADFFRAVESVPTIQMSTLVFSADGTVRSSLAYVSYSDIDQLSRAAAATGLSVEQESTLTEGERIASDVVIGRRR
ncbi:MAG TPA: type II secretion system protein GspL, partial [Caulobacteraceae bacterium]|nr:type II secretion system protein GspL [Caulobacteraceae bacterium]